MSMEETKVLLSEKSRDRDCDNTDDSADEDEPYQEEDGTKNDNKYIDEPSRLVDEQIYEVGEKASDAQCAEVSSGAYDELFPNMIRNTNGELPIGPVCDEMENRNQTKTESIDFGSFKVPTSTPTSVKDVHYTGSGSLSQHKKLPKLAFCPKEVKRIIDSEFLQQMLIVAWPQKKLLIVIMIVFKQ